MVFCLNSLVVFIKEVLKLKNDGKKEKGKRVKGRGERGEGRGNDLKLRVILDSAYFGKTRKNVK